MPEAISAALQSPYLTKRDVRILTWQIYLAVAAFAIGILAGFAQAIDRVLPASSTLWNYFPLQENYYQGLTSHGVLLAFVFTFAFSNGLMTLAAAHSFKRRPNTIAIGGSLLLIVVGGVLAAWQIIANEASVLFTMYPPLQASPIYYLGVTLVVVSTWFTALAVLLMYRSWRSENKGERIPLQGFTAIATYAMWFIASLGVAIEVLVLLLPWSLGLVDKTDPQLARALFWFSGHPVVYFWLLPAYVSWYTMIPKQVGGKLFSDSLTRFVFLLFLVLSIPTGFHHQYTDPGISEALKTVHFVMTMGVFFPSLITAFSVMASLESGGRRAGGKGLLGWIWKLPWGDPSVVAQLLAMLGFVLGGVSGLINASYTVNLVVHNTSWVPGHFHLTVGTAVALSFMGIAYWLVPHLTGRALPWRRTALAQAWLWFIGVMLFSRGQISAGIDSLPRRLNVSKLDYVIEVPSWESGHMLTAIGGTIMFISGSIFVALIIWTVLRGRKGTIVEMPVADEFVSGPEETSPILDRWAIWITLAIVLILIAYGPFFLTYVPNFISGGYTPW